MSGDFQEAQRGALERAVHDALETPVAADAAARVLQRIAGRSPRALNAHLRDARLRAVTAVAAAVLVCLSTFGGELRPAEPEAGFTAGESWLSAVVVLDAAEIEGQVTVAALFSELFDVEVPE